MKAVLVIDMPEHCYECPVVNYKHCNANYFIRRNHGGNIPYNFSNEYIHEQGRQTWCPLRPLPEKQKLTVAGKNQIEKKRIIKSKSLEQIKKGFINNSEVAFYCGYNACLDEILGEEND